MKMAELPKEISSCSSAILRSAPISITSICNFEAKCTDEAFVSPEVPGSEGEKIARGTNKGTGYLLGATMPRISRVFRQ